VLDRPSLDPGYLSAIYELIFEKIDIGLLWLNPEGLIIYGNRKVALLSGYQYRIGQEKPWQNFAALQGNNPLSQVISDTLTEGREYQKEILFVTATKQEIPCLVRTLLLKDNFGRNIGVLITMLEITKRKELEIALFRAEKLAVAGQLAAGAAHEMRNPLTAIRGFIQLLQYQISNPAHNEYLNIIIREIDRINTILNQFLILARPGATQMVSTDLTELVDEIETLVNSEALLRNISITKKVDAGLPEVTLNREQIKQVMLNLIKNAIEAMPEGGLLDIRVCHSVPAETIKVVIADTGVGMNADLRARIFEPFITNKKDGTGLGLFVSRSIIEGLRGHIQLESEPGRGTVVTVELPVSSL